MRDVGSSLLDMRTYYQVVYHVNGYLRLYLHIFWSKNFLIEDVVKSITQNYQ